MPSPWRLLLCPVLIELQHLLLNTNKRVGKISVWQLYNGDLYPFQEICGLLLILFNQLWIFFDALNYLRKEFNRMYKPLLRDMKKEGIVWQAFKPPLPESILDTSYAQV